MTTIYKKKTNDGIMRPVITQIISNVIAYQKRIEEDANVIIFEMGDRNNFEVKMQMAKKIPYIEVKGTSLNGNIHFIKQRDKLQIVSGDMELFNDINRRMNAILTVKKSSGDKTEED